MGDIVDTAVSAGSFTVLAAALTKADLVTTMKSTGPFTVFAPTDDAFAAALTALGVTKEELLNKPDLKDILTYHVVSGSVKSTDLTDGMKAATVNGAKVTITIAGTNVKVNDSTVSAADVMCSNGVIHIIDKVLLPPAANAKPAPEPEPEPEPAPAPAPADATTTAAAGTTPASSTRPSTQASSAQTSQSLVSLTLGAILSAGLSA